MYDVDLELIGNRVVDFLIPISVNWTFFVLC